MSANIFMLFDCFLDEDQDVIGMGWGTGYGGGRGKVEGYGAGYGNGSGRNDGNGGGQGRSEGKGYISWGEGYGRSDDGDTVYPIPVLCLIKVRSP